MSICASALFRNVFSIRAVTECGVPCAVELALVSYVSFTAMCSECVSPSLPATCVFLWCMCVCKTAREGQKQAELYFFFFNLFGLEKITRASLVAQLVKNPPAMQETLV